MIVCAACDKPMKRNAYCWSISWDRPEGYAKKKFSVSFHNKPSCVSEMMMRMDGYIFDQRMSAAFENVDWDEQDELIVYTEQKGD